MHSDPALPPIHVVRGQRVMLDGDLARLYGATTPAFNQAIRRNLDRFPPDFLFQLTLEELARLKARDAMPDANPEPALRSQIVILKPSGRGRHRKYPTLAFTEHGAIMAATILRSPRAVAMSVYVVRAFVRLREEALTHAVILRRLVQIDRKLLEHDVVLRDVVAKLAPLLQPPPAPPPAPPKPKIGFHQGNR